MNLGIRAKLLAGFGAVIALMMVVGAVGVWGLEQRDGRRPGPG